MAKRLSLFWRWFLYWRAVDDGFSFADDVRTSWYAAKHGRKVPEVPHV